MKTKIIGFSIVSILAFFLTGCAQNDLSSRSSSATRLSGYVISGQPLANAQVTLWDAQGNHLQTTTDRKGEYDVVVEGLLPPILISASEDGFSNISDNSKPRGLAVSALVAGINQGELNTANVNPLSDKVVSDVAKSMKMRGPVSLIIKGNTQEVSAEAIQQYTNENRLLIQQALSDAGIKNVELYDPVKTPMTRPMFRVYAMIIHNRSYHTKSGEIAETMLFDNLFHPLSLADPLDFNRGLDVQKKLLDKSTVRVFLAGDSTVSNYESERNPRAGWGQMFHTMFKDEANVLIINAAISGRSSRSYINEGWLRMYADLIQPNDYLFIEFGHNDEKCGSNPSKPRDVFDNANTCTYANDGQSMVQGEAEMSFQRWLEKYIDVAQSKQATPVVLTPITRIARAKDKKTGVFPIKSSTHIVYREKSSGQYVGDYAQTVRDTARANNIALIDLDKATTDWANSLGEPDWKQYWLAVDDAVYPYYKKGKTGNIDKPDGTHLQKNGAVKVSSMVAKSIKSDAQLADLANYMK